MSKILPAYEHRPAQIEMATVVAHAMQGQTAALIEAGTGIGKTLAYLVPLVTLGLRVVVSTGTRNLQEQILRKDIPVLEKCFGRTIRAYCLKGRGNYLCRRRWKLFASHPGLTIGGAGKRRADIQSWLACTEQGDRTELEWLPEDDPLWAEICSTTETCLGQRCADYERCFVTIARQEAAAADIVVVNHHLLVADCCLRARSGVYAIPPYARLILDEAHMLEQVATEYFGCAVSNHRIQELIRDIRHEIAAVRGENAEIAGASERTLKAGGALFDSLSWCEDRFSINDRVITGNTKDTLHLLIRMLTQLREHLGRLETTSDALTRCSQRAQEIQSSLEFVYDHGDPEFVFWGERRGRTVTLRVSPIDVSRDLAAHLFNPLRGLVLTSATLSTDQGFEYIKARLGMESDHELIVESHFDYAHQAVIFIPRDMPDPATEEFAERIGRQSEQILRVTQGRALLLFTSYRNLERVYRYLKNIGIEYRLLKQGEGSKEHLLAEFWRDIPSVLLATGSFWQGIDIPGESLSCVVIDRLPFSVPTDPVTEARIQWIRHRGGNPFFDYQLPSAIITLKQGLGRLIRHREDRGLLVILDPRIFTKSYGRTILRNLPACPVVSSLEEVRSAARRLKIIDTGD
ncbi:MAG: ATP-dependent DNA helicase [bacterium]